MIQYAKSILDNQNTIKSRILLYAICAFMVAAVSFADLKSGFEISMFIFYAAPIWLASWYGGKTAGFLVAILSIFGWVIADNMANYTYSHPLIPYWNGTIRISFFILTAVALSTLRQKLIAEKQNAHTDILTSLFNARGFRERAEILHALLKREEQAFALAFIDVDNFKTINDTIGHTEGDRVLKTIATTLNENLRKSDVISRIGGDEFVIFLPRAITHQANSAIIDLKHNLDAMAKGENWPIGFSIGIGIFNSANTDIDQALKTADTLMYDVKKQHKGDIKLHDFTETQNAGIPH